MTLRRAWTAAWAVMLALLLAACAAAPPSSPPRDAALGPWTGRLGLQIEGKPEGSFSASFELKGNPLRGELLLTSPLGGTLGLLQWEPGKALLRSNSRTTEYESVDALVAQVAGAPIPVAALFDWLRGIDTRVPGWTANLSQLAQGRVSATRYDPPPQTDLRVVLER